VPRTATFVDGNAKAVQLQTEQSTTSNGFNGSSFMISGPESVDKFGRTSQVYADFSSAGNRFLVFLRGTKELIWNELQQLSGGDMNDSLRVRLIT